MHFNALALSGLDLSRAGVVLQQTHAILRMPRAMTLPEFTVVRFPRRDLVATIQKTPRQEHRARVDH